MFCPYCANLLVVEPHGGAMRFACRTCPYHYKIGKRLKKSAHIEQKKVRCLRFPEPGTLNLQH
jgi:DNA-directed RNA polymerase subunit M/transcription elongation factor TFIIS